jgi:fatty acid desaturase
MGAVRFRYHDGVWWNAAVLAYGFGGYGVGLVLLATGGPFPRALGVLLVAHALVVLSYLLHDVIHGTIFARPGHNALLGAAIAWLNGSCFSGFSTLRDLHLRHHAARADFVRYDFKRFLATTPRPVRRLFLGLEWLHFPAIELLMRGAAIRRGLVPAAGWRRRSLTVALLMSRVGFFVLLGWISLPALILHGVAYTLFVCSMRFFDAHQHTYQAFCADGPAPVTVRDRAYEHSHTYSNLVSARWWWLNLLNLNFSYHNAHHARPAAAWYQLPRLHRQLYPPTEPQLLPVRELLDSYHRNRIARLLEEDYGAVGDGPGRASQFVGAVGVSFLY